jgi:periplasmic protein TonB
LPRIKYELQTSCWAATDFRRIAAQSVQLPLSAAEDTKVLDMIKSSVRILAIAFAIASPLFAQSKIDPPVAVRQVAPEYPEQLKDQHVMGIVVVKCTIDAQGNVTDPEIEKSSNEGFDQSALTAIKKWKFKPAHKDGSPVALKVSIPIKFIAES